MTDTSRSRDLVKMLADAVFTGTGVMKDGKHVPIEDVYLDPRDARIEALEADSARLMGLVKDVEQTLALIYAGDEGPVLLNNSVKAVCARRHEVGGLLRNVIRTLAKIKEATDD